MDISLQKSLEKAWTALMAAVWAAIGGGTGVVVDALHDYATYEGPLDAPRLRKLFLAGAIVGFVMWMRKEKALATPVPATPENDAAALKRAAEAADKSITVIHSREVL